MCQLQHGRDACSPTEAVDAQGRSSRFSEQHPSNSISSEHKTQRVYKPLSRPQQCKQPTVSSPPVCTNHCLVPDSVHNTASRHPTGAPSEDAVLYTLLGTRWGVHGVDHLGREGRGHPIFEGPPHHLARGQRHDGPDPLAPRHQRVPHRLDRLCWCGGHDITVLG